MGCRQPGSGRNSIPRSPGCRPGWASWRARSNSRRATPQVYHAVDQADYFRSSPHPRRKVRDGAAVSAGAGGLLLGVAGGTARPGENAAEACRRELLEETGFTMHRCVRRLGKSPSPDGSRIASTASSSPRANRSWARAGSRHHHAAGVASRSRPPDHPRRLQLPAPSRRPAARGAPRLSGPAAERCEATDGAQGRARTALASFPRCRSCDRTLDPVETSRKRKAGGIVCDTPTEIRKSPAEDVDTLAVHPGRHDQ